MKFIVHLGDGKCGSTSIQQSLFASRDALKTQGIAYDTTMTRNGHAWLVTLVGGKTRGDDERLRAASRETIERVRAQAMGCEYVLLSGENFLSLEPEHAFKIFKLFGLPIDSIDLIAYIRDPVSMYLSLIQQGLRGHHVIKAPHAYRRPIDKWIKSWIDFNKTSSLSIGLFDPSRLLQNDAVADFEARLRLITRNHELNLPRIRSNTSLTAEQMIVLQDFRLKFLSDRAGKLAPESQSLIRLFEDLTRAGISGTKPKLTEAAISAVSHANKETVEAVNSLVPGLGVRLRSVQLKSEENKVAPRAPVSEILEHFDQNRVELLKALNPHHNPPDRPDRRVMMQSAVRRLAEEKGADSSAVLAAIKGYRLRETLDSGGKRMAINEQSTFYPGTQNTSRCNMTYNKMKQRREFAEINTDLEKPLLEIGALNSPLFSRPKHDAYILDWLSEDELIKAYPQKDNIRPVDFIVRGKRLHNFVDRQFHTVIACHVIEHIPDVLGWLDELEQMTDDTGRLILAVPDRRFTFDYIRRTSETADFLRAQDLDQEVPDIGQLFDHLYRYQKIKAHQVWAGEEIKISPPRFGLRAAYEKAREMKSIYNSIHCHVFTESTFKQVFEELYEMGVTGWRIIDILAVQPGGNEFLVALSKRRARNADVAKIDINSPKSA